MMTPPVTPAFVNDAIVALRDLMDLAEELQGRGVWTRGRMIVHTLHTADAIFAARAILAKIDGQDPPVRKPLTSGRPEQEEKE